MKNEAMTVLDLVERFAALGLPVCNMNVWEALNAAEVKGAVYFMMAAEALEQAKRQVAASTPAIIVIR